MRQVAAQLGGAFQHDHTRHQRHSGHVAASPELVLGEVFVAYDQLAFGILVNDRRQLLHLVTLRVVSTNFLDVRNDVAYYLDNPDEFGKFYVVARAYAAAWGLVGVLAVFAIGRRLASARVGVLAALLFTLMPVVVCMAHEGKPNLPGAVLMLLAVLLAMRHLSRQGSLGQGMSTVHRYS